MEKSNYTIHDVIKSDKHMEMINGFVVVEDVTTPYHNIAITEIATALKNHITSNDGDCVVFTENVGLFVNELCDTNKYFYMPDVMVVCDKTGIQADGVHSVPRFVVEVTSDTTRKYDYWEKLEIYREIGVDEYWIVDLQKKVILQYLASEEYIPQCFIHPQTMKVESYEGLTISTSAFMQ